MRKLLIAAVFCAAGLVQAEPLRGQENCSYFAVFAGRVAMARDSGNASKTEVMAQVDQAIEFGRQKDPKMVWAAPEDRPYIAAAVDAIFVGKDDPTTTAKHFYKACMARSGKTI